MRDKVVLVTGSSQGIGEAIARLAAARGAAVVVNSRRRERAQRIAAELEAAGATVAVAPGDVAEAADVDAIVSVAIEQFGRVDVLVNSARIAPTGPSETLPLTEFRQVLATNLVGAMMCAQVAGRHMLERGGGTIVNIGSIWGNEGMPERAAYPTSKHALAGFNRALSQEWAARGVRVVSVDPSYIATAMIDDESGYADDDLTRRTPIGRLGRPEEVAEAVVFAASDEGSALTGPPSSPTAGGWPTEVGDDRLRRPARHPRVPGPARRLHLRVGSATGAAVRGGAASRRHVRDGGASAAARCRPCGRRLRASAADEPGWARPGYDRARAGV